MATTYTLISSNTLSSSAASVTFSSIPSTYTDLVLLISARTDRAAIQDGIRLVLNSDSSSNYSYTLLQGTGSGTASVTSGATTRGDVSYIDGNSSTANTFGNAEVYIPSYIVSANHQIGSFGVSENNATTAYLGIDANLWRNAVAINTITLSPGGGSNFLTNSSFYLYGIKNS